MKKYRSIIVAFAAGLLIACGTGVEALSGADAQRITALETAAAQATQQIAALSTQIAALQTSITTLGSQARPSVFVQAPSSAAVRAMTAARAKASASTASEATTACTGLGTLTGRPDSSNPITSSLLAGFSCTGYLYVITQAASATDQAILQSIPPSTLLWTSSDCTGLVYVSPNYNSGALSSGVFVSGAVFRRAGSPAAPTDPADPSTYLYVPANAAGTSIVVGSFLQIQPNSENCIAYSSFNTPPPTITGAVEVLPNDPAVTGIPSAPIAGPITIGPGV